MTPKLKLLLTIGALCASAGCRHEDPVVTVAKSDFRTQGPKVEIVDSGVRSRDAVETVVYVRFVSRPVSSSQAGILEDEMTYRNEGGKWQCMSIKGGTYIRPAR